MSKHESTYAAKQRLKKIAALASVEPETKPEPVVKQEPAAVMSNQPIFPDWRQGDSHWCGVMPVEVSPEGIVKVMVTNYCQTGHGPEIRLFGGTDQKGRSPEETLRNEIGTELCGADSDTFTMEYHKTPIRHEKRKDEDDPEAVHHKYVYLVWKLYGNLRTTEDWVEDDGTILSPGYYIELNQLLGLLFQQLRTKFYFRTVVKGLEFLMERDSNVARRYRGCYNYYRKHVKY